MKKLIMLTFVVVSSYAQAVVVPLSESPGTCSFNNLPTCDFSATIVRRSDGAAALSPDQSRENFLDNTDTLSNCSDDSSATLTSAEVSITATEAVSWTVNGSISVDAQIVAASFEAAVGAVDTNSATYSMPAQDVTVDGCKTRDLTRKADFKVKGVSVTSFYTCEKTVTNEDEDVPCQIGFKHYAYPGVRISTGTEKSLASVATDVDLGGNEDC